MSHRDEVTSNDAFSLGRVCRSDKHMRTNRLFARTYNAVAVSFTEIPDGWREEQAGCGITSRWSD
ncbi:hypothetical protein CLAM6_11530 [Cobetia sp. AM6]|nr:hypothetical protein CLAM6_11530 [Cobetia sp. AM6]